MRDRFVGTAALGNIFDDVDDVARLTRQIAMLMRRDVMKRCSVPGPSHKCSSRNRPSADCGVLSSWAVTASAADFKQDVENRLADHDVARNAELRLGHAVDQGSGDRAHPSR